MWGSCERHCANASLTGLSLHTQRSQRKHFATLKPEVLIGFSMSFSNLDFCFISRQSQYVAHTKLELALLSQLPKGWEDSMRHHIQLVITV